MISTEELLGTIRGEVLLGESMKEHTALKIGGSVDFFVDPIDREDLCRAIALFEARNLPYELIGRGSNLLVDDDGVRGALIITSRALGGYSVRKNILTAGAGTPLPVIAEKTFGSSLEVLRCFRAYREQLAGRLP